MKLSKVKIVLGKIIWGSCLGGDFSKEESGWGLTGFAWAPTSLKAYNKYADNRGQNFTDRLGINLQYDLFIR